MVPARCCAVSGEGSMGFLCNHAHFHLRAQYGIMMVLWGVAWARWGDPEVRVLESCWRTAEASLA
eukprot:9369448-Alexandrium_andersonii.AAC.1